MPKPHPTRDKFLKYLRSDLAHDKPWVDFSDIYSSDEIRAAIKKVSDKDKILYKILYYYVTTRMSRMAIAEAVNYDSSTVKRKLDDAADLILQKIKMPEPEEDVAHV